LRTTVHVVREPADQQDSPVIPRRWAVERTFAWLSAHCRLAGPTHSNVVRLSNQLIFSSLF
jgi:transposase